MPNDLIKLPAFDEFHAEVARAIALAYFVDRNNPGMFQASCRLRFQTKTLQMRFRGPLTQPNDLQGDGAIKTFLTCSKHYALTAASNLLKQFVIAKLHQHRRD